MSRCCGRDNNIEALCLPVRRWDFGNLFFTFVHYTRDTSFTV